MAATLKSALFLLGEAERVLDTPPFPRPMATSDCLADIRRLDAAISRWLDDVSPKMSPRQRLALIRSSPLRRISAGDALLAERRAEFASVTKRLRVNLLLMNSLTGDVQQLIEATERLVVSYLSTETSRSANSSPPPVETSLRRGAQSPGRNRPRSHSFHMGMAGRDDQRVYG